ncbi:MAG: response regulator [Acidobacteriota bacterium]
MSIAPRILYVDDDPDGRELMFCRLTQGHGFELTTAADGSHARKSIEQEFFDLYLLDYCLPDTTATSLCSQIKLFNPDAPIIVYSALDREIDRKLALEAGATLYFIKPEQIELMVSEIGRMLSRRTAGPPKPQWPASGHSSFVIPQQQVHVRRKASGIV